MDFRFIDGTITTPQGFTGAAICGGIKEGNTTKKDIMMVKCDTLCNAAAVYTKNLGQKTHLTKIIFLPMLTLSITMKTVKPHQPRALMFPITTVLLIGKRLKTRELTLL